MEKKFGTGKRNRRNRPDLGKTPLHLRDPFPLHILPERLRLWLATIGNK